MPHLAISGTPAIPAGLFATPIVNVVDCGLVNIDCYVEIMEIRQTRSHNVYRKISGRPRARCRIGPIGLHAGSHGYTQ